MKIAGIINGFWRLVVRHKYVSTFIVALLIIGFIEDDSLLRLIQLRTENAQLEKEIKYYDDCYQSDFQRLEELKRDPQALIRVAREKHQMHSDDEDIYLVSYEGDVSKE